MDRERFVAEVARRVPAYQRFLEQQGVTPTDSWEALPRTTKANYLLANPTPELCWDGTLRGAHLIGASSGFSKAGAVFWPKRPDDEQHYIDGLERMFVDHYGIDRRRTLLFVSLALGTWIAGMALASALRTLAGTGRHPLTVSTPGLNLQEAVEIYARFGAEFEQVIWITNPSSINLVIALLARQGVSVPPGTVYFPVVGEYFSERFRERVAERFGHQQSAPFVVWTGYGSADAGELGVETRDTIALRKYFYHRPALSREWFGTTDTPMLHAMPDEPFVEQVDGTLVVTRDQLVPLVRYDTGDAGGLLDHARLMALADLPEDLRARLPERILYVYGRASDAIIFYGTNLSVGEIGDYLLSLPDDYGYGGLFEMRRHEQADVTTFEFSVYVHGGTDERGALRYQQSLLDFLKHQSLEFAAKYDALSRAIGQPLITVRMRDVAEAPNELKHRYLIEDG